MQILRLCQKAGMVSLGHVALDGTKVQANASKHKAMSHERMLKASPLPAKLSPLSRDSSAFGPPATRKLVHPPGRTLPATGGP